MDDRVNTYDPGAYRPGYNKGAAGQPGGQGGQGGQGPQGPRKKFTWKKGLLIFALILGAVIIAGFGLNYFTRSAKTESGAIGNGQTIDYTSPYIGVLHVEGTISDSDSSSLLSSTTYYHKWTLARIDDMIKDKDNKGLIIYVNSPGGSVYASDELYLKVKEYQRETGRPVYAYMGSMAASGGYYCIASSDKIVANRNCWTGSIGVTIGTLYDVTGLLKKYGIKTVTINSGKNKAMGSATTKMTSQQKKIFQGLVDEAYDQFVGIVASGRKMPVSKVRKLADGRIYTAKQAKRLGLCDQISSLEAMEAEMQGEYGHGNTEIKDITYKDNSGFLGNLLGSALGTDIAKKAINSFSGADSEYSQIKTLMGENNKFTITYMSNISK